MTERGGAERRRSGDPRKTQCTTTNAGPIRREDEAAIRRLVRDLQDAQNSKNGELFASAFAPEHDYVAINGMFLPNQTRKDNARVHQRLYDEGTSSVAGKYGDVEVRLGVAKIRPVGAEGVAVVHIEGEFRPKGAHETQAKNIVSAVVQRRKDGWEIVAFHNAPVQKRMEEEAGFVIRVQGVGVREGARR
jgi:uncharacterized protein (TIGR02246 family)